MRLRVENVTPRKVFLKGRKRASFEYQIAGAKRRDVVIEVMPKGGTEPVKRWTHRDVQPGATHRQTWGGGTLVKGKARRGREGKAREESKARSHINRKGRARNGRYLFRVRGPGGRLAERSKAEGSRAFGFYHHIFPIRRRHDYGDGLGAPRSGHRHQGQDLFARCGAKLVAARAGKVQYKGYQGGGAGYYLVIDGKQTRRDYVYMHLRRKPKVRQGDRVKTGERIGEVGRSGNASGCHLHFELWSKPGWYEGGRFLNPTKKLRRWDRWS